MLCVALLHVVQLAVVTVVEQRLGDDPTALDLQVKREGTAVVIALSDTLSSFLLSFLCTTV